MDTYAHVNTQGASVDVFMPYWWNKGFIKPLTLYKKMAYAATVNTIQNMNDAIKGRNVAKLINFSFGTYVGGEVLMAIQNTYLGTPFPTKDEDAFSRIGVALWKAEFMGILSEFNKVFYGDDQIGFQIYPSVLTTADNATTALTNTFNIWTDMEGVSSPIRAELTAATFEQFLSRTFSLYGNFKKAIMNKKSKYNTEYEQQKKYFREFADEMGLDSNVGIIEHTNNNYWKLFENAWNRSYLTGDKESFQRVFWMTFWGVANDYYIRGSNEDGITIRTRQEAIKEAYKNIKKKVKALNPNKYTLTKKSKIGKIKGIKYRLWLGKQKSKQLDSLEAQFWKYHREWWGKDIYDSINKFHMQDMKKYFK